MKLRYDQKADAVYITLRGHGVDHTVRIGPDIAIDYGPDGEVHGIEILAASEHLGLRPDKPEVILEHLQGISVANGDDYHLIPAA